jgi:hypothetical protein
MKRITINSILAVVLTATVFLTACTKEDSQVRLAPTLATSQLLNITSNSATVVGFVVAQGDGFTEKGVCYNTSPAPTVSNSKVVYTGTAKTASFNVTLDGLNYATKYYARAYATGSAGTIYGDEYSFTTLPVVPTLTTTAITAITGNSATGGGNVTVTGGAEITARGVCFGTEHNPTTANSKTVDDESNKGTGQYTSSLTALKGNTTYYVRAYATNSAGTGYGPEVSFKTNVDLAVVTTAVVNGITKTEAYSGGDVTYDGGGSVTAKGLVWSTNANPTTADNKIDGGTGTGPFISHLTGLTSNTVYHVRAFATNSAGTAYGADVQFNTLADILTMWVVGDYNGWNNSDAAQIIQSTTTSNGQAEGYVFLKHGGIKLVTDHSWDDAHTYGDNGSGGLTNPGGNISVPADGYYLVKANLGTMTYSLTATVWGIIGDATAGGWGNQTNMTYDPTSKTFHIGAHLTAGGGSFKFRGTPDWSINYGSTAADGKTLNAGGDNIPVAVEGDYALTLDLSHPNAYTYSANRWGLIGDATPGGWGTSTPMTWDASKNVFTVTVDLVASGSFKFRANDAWDINYGGNMSALTPGGSNIPVPSDGNYTVTFDPWGLTATLTKN